MINKAQIFAIMLTKVAVPLRGLPKHGKPQSCRVALSARVVFSSRRTLLGCRLIRHALQRVSRANTAFSASVYLLAGFSRGTALCPFGRLEPIHITLTCAKHPHQHWASAAVFRCLACLALSQGCTIWDGLLVPLVTTTCPLHGYPFLQWINIASSILKTD